MKSRTIFIIALLAMIIFACKEFAVQKIPEAFRPYIKNGTTEIEYKPIYGLSQESKKIPEKLSRNQAHEDLEMLEYLMESSYSGYEFWMHEGVDFDSCYQNIRQWITAQDSVSSLLFENKIASILKLLRDGHIAFEGYGYHPAMGHKSIYFADVILQKNPAGQFVVIQSENNGVQEGSVFTSAHAGRFLFPTLSASGKQDYLLGILSFDFISELELSFDDSLRTLAFHENRMLFDHQEMNPPVIAKTIDGTDYIRVSSFRNHLHEMMQEFIISADTLKDKETIIIDVRDNGGGSSAYPQDFIKRLNGSIDWEMHIAELRSPAISEHFYHYDPAELAKTSPGYKSMVSTNARLYEGLKNNPRKIWNFSYAGDYGREGNFDGRMIMLTNRSVISGGESMIGASLCLKERIAIGENTGGVARFSSNTCFYLPNSHIMLHLPRQFIIIPGLEERLGFKPDFWLDSKETLEESLKWIKNPNDYQFRYNSPYDSLLISYQDEVEFPKEISLIPPDESISDSLAFFSGFWFGMDGGKLGHGLMVSKIINPDEIEAVYAWGNKPEWNVQAGWMPLTGQFKDGKLSLKADDFPLQITYAQNSDGSLYSIFERPGIYAESRLIRLHKKIKH